MMNIFVFFGAVLGVAIASQTEAAPVNVTNDRLGLLIQRVDYQLSADSIKKTENQLLGRASWNIQCWVNSGEQTKICTMRKEHITVMRMNNYYSLSVGSKHSKNSTTSIKVDNNSVLQTREGLYRDADAILDQFKRGLEVKTEFNSSNKPVVNTISLIGFSEAYKDMQQQYEKLDSFSL